MVRKFRTNLEDRLLRYAQGSLLSADERDGARTNNGGTMSERMRLSMLRARDGENAAKEWAQSTLQLYRQSMENPAHFASQSEWKARFDYSTRELAAFIERGTLETREVTHDD